MFLHLLLFIIFNISLVSFTQTHQSLNVLHISFHKGCLKELESIAPEIGINITSWFVNEDPAKYDGCKCGNAIYNVDKFRAKRVWNLNKDYFDTFDVIFTSDTAPLSRIFLQNNWKKPLIIWVCNRFDYVDGGSRNRYFPDTEYYNLIRSIPHRPNV